MSDIRSSAKAELADSTVESLEACREWLLRREAIDLIAGEARNHIDTASVAFTRGWEAAIEWVTRMGQATTR